MIEPSKEGIMRLYFFGGRQHGRKRALDLVAGQIAELQQRSETAAKKRKQAAHQPLQGSWVSPAEVDYSLADHVFPPYLRPEDCLYLPSMSVKRRSVDDLKMEARWE
jgi:hypothetical protein